MASEFPKGLILAVSSTKRHAAASGVSPLGVLLPITFVLMLKIGNLSAYSGTPPEHLPKEGGNRRFSAKPGPMGVNPAVLCNHQPPVKEV